MKRPARTWIIFTLMVLSVPNAHALTWDWLRLYPTELEALVRFDGIDRRNNNDFNSQDTEWQAGVFISQQGYILDPGIARFLLELEPVWVWGKFDSTTVKEDRSGNLLNYLVQVNLLQGTPGPFGFELSAVRNANLNTTTLGGRYDNEIDIKSASISWKTPVFPMRLKYEENLLKQNFVSGQSSSASVRDELLKTLSIEGRSSKLRLIARHESMDDRVLSRDQDYDVDFVNLTHKLPWGTNSQLHSRFDYFDRTGFNANRRLTFEERARIQHTDNIFSHSLYRFNELTQNLKAREHTGEFRLHYQLYGNLTTSAHMTGNTRDSDILNETAWRAGLDGNYRKADFFGARVNAGLGYAYQVTDRDSKLGLVEVVDEAHLITLGGAVILNRRFIITATIIVTSANGTLVYSEGIDYIALPLSNDLTQLQTIPGGRISTGDTILVTYKAVALPSQEFSTTFTNFNLGFDLGWVRASHYDRKTDDKLISGAGEYFLNDIRDIVTDIEFRWTMAGIDASVGAERRYRDTVGFESTTFTYRQLLTWAAFGNTVWDLSAIESFTEAGELDTDLYHLELSVDWQPLIGLSIRPVLGAWQRLDKSDSITGGRRDDEFITAGFTLRWFYRKVALDLGYHYNRRTTDARQTNENRLMFNLRRQF